jgi:cell division topological specificity factor
MSSLFDRMLGRNNKESSASQAKERLQFVLVHDRINLPPERMAAMKEEILAVISKYVAVSSADVDITLQQQDRNNNRLVAEIPFSKPIASADPDEDENPRAKYKPDSSDS